MTIPVVDIFAGPGGLGEGFSAFRAPGAESRAFSIAVSAEMEANAARTLRLRAFFRQFAKGQAPSSYYDYVRGRAKLPWTERTEAQWDAACKEALQLTLGSAEHDQLLYDRIASVARRGNPWILVGGPPCQAYSLVGRSRNAGISGYRAEDDKRHYLYEHYLHIIRRYQPTAFIMENVKGILSSKVGGQLIFPKILSDLRRPGRHGGKRYRLIPLVERINAQSDISPEDFVVHAERLGVPQARHRVILFGLDEEIPEPEHFLRYADDARVTVADAIAEMTPVRSDVTDSSYRSWPQFAGRLLMQTARDAKRDFPDVASRLFQVAREVEAAEDPGTGGQRVAKMRHDSSFTPAPLRRWLVDRRLAVHLNHEARAHMADDLKRYAFAAAFATETMRSPKGHLEFPERLAPAHGNWATGKFADRFKVQVWDNPSSTVTSHLSKDGHYFIHPDPQQIRSLTVREAARLQTFPDNYFFEGARGAQFRQVGNAVPPLLAHQIAAVVYRAINR